MRMDDVPASVMRWLAARDEAEQRRFLAEMLPQDVLRLRGTPSAAR